MPVWIVRGCFKILSLHLCFGLDGHRSPLFRNHGADLSKSFLGDVQAAKPIDHTLNHSPCSSQEVGIVTTLGLCKDPERRKHIRLIGLLEVLVGVGGVVQSAVKDRKDGESHGWGSLVRDLRLVELKVSPDLSWISDVLQREGEQVDVRLFDRSSCVGSILFGDVGVCELMNHYFAGDVLPLGIGSVSHQFLRLVCQPKRCLCHRVGECVIVDVFRPLISSNHVVDMVHSVLLFHSTLPKLGSLGQHPVSLLTQPALVLGNSVIIPGSESHTTSDMVLQGTSHRPDWCFFGAVTRTLPREHGSIIAINVSISNGLVKSAISVFHHGVAQIRIEGQHTWVHPKVHVPEDVAVVPCPTKSHGAESKVRVGIQEAVQMIEHHPHILLVLRVARDLNICLIPLFIPTCLMLRRQLVNSQRVSSDKSPQGFVVRIRVEIAGQRTRHYREFILLPLLELLIKRYIVHIRIPDDVVDVGCLLSLPKEEHARSEQLQLTRGANALAGHHAQHLPSVVEVLEVLLDPTHIVKSLELVGGFQGHVLAGSQGDFDERGKGQGFQGVILVGG